MNLEQMEQFLLQVPIWQFMVGGILFVYVIQYYITRPVYVKSPDFYDNNSKKIKSIRTRDFPPPYPNGWIRVCSSVDVADGNIKSISALGREFVAFRGADGKVGVLDAYCPHLGAHLGQGGTLCNGNLRCPFHGWEFDTKGKAVTIPYCRVDIPERAKTKAYIVREILGMVFIWFHAEPEKQNEPEYELEYLNDCKGDNFYYVTSRSMQFDQHVLEMHMNSADYYHFQTLHRPLPFPFLEKFLFGQHDLKAEYFTKRAPSHICFFQEKMVQLCLFGKVPIVPRAILQSIDVNVTFEGPAIVHFSVKTIFGEMRMIKTILPVAPFKVHVEARWWAEKTVPRFMCYAMSIVAAKALEQDRQVWENKIFQPKPMLVAGDGPMPAFRRYYNQFYSENSLNIAKDDLSW